MKLMVDPNKTVQAFKDSFDKMSPEEQKIYLAKMGFSFESSDNTSIPQIKTLGRAHLTHYSINTRTSLPRYAKMSRKNNIYRVHARKKKVDS